MTKKDVFSLPLMDECIDALNQTVFFSKVDANNAYYQIPVDEDSKEKTAFRTKHGLFHFNFMPFGLANAPGTFSRVMALVLKGLNWKTVLAFLDDLCVIGTSFEDHLENLRQVLERFREFGLKLKPKKCELFKDEVEFLGRKIGKKGITLTDHSKQTIKEWREPKTFKEVQQFLGFVNFHRQFIAGFAETCEPLQEIVKNKKYEWLLRQQDAFDTRKEQLQSPPVLAIPNQEDEFVLDTDASNCAIGAELLQRQEGQLRTIGYGSFTLTKPQRKYCATRRELLAVVRFLHHFRHYLLGKKFTLRTDHNSLNWLKNFKNLDGQMARWMEEISRYDHNMIHRPGREHVNADFLSRPTVTENCIEQKEIPCGKCKYCKRVEEKWKEFEEKIDDVTELRTSDLSVKRVASTLSEEQQAIEIEWKKPVEGNIRQVQSEKETNSIMENKEIIRKAQANDKSLKMLREWLENKKEPDSEELRMANQSAKFYWANKELFFKAEGIIYMKDEEHDILVIPEELQEECLKLSHDPPSSAHQGITRTKEKMRKSFFWYKMAKDVKKFVSGCNICNQNKGGRRKNRFPLIHDHAGTPMEKVHIDFIGPLPKTRRGNEHILVISDSFTKWCECIALPTQKAEITARTVVDQFFTRFGFPAQIVTDQGRNFESNLFTEVCKLLKIKKSRTTAYRPSANGQAERTNRTLVAAIRCTIDQNEDTWDEQLPQLVMAMRSAVNRATGQTPNRMMLGREINTPVNLMLPKKANDPSSPEEDCNELEKKMQETHEIARAVIKTQLKRSKSDHDIHARTEKFQAGDIVYLVDKARTNKLKPMYMGPVIITEVRSPYNFRVKVKTRELKVVHHDTMKLCRDRKVPQWISREREAILEAKERRYCICNQPDDGLEMIQCDQCHEWYHCHCVELTKRMVKEIKEYFCPKCRNESD